MRVTSSYPAKYVTTPLHCLLALSFNYLVTPDILTSFYLAAMQVFVVLSFFLTTCLITVGIKTWEYWPYIVQYLLSFLLMPLLFVMAGYCMMSRFHLPSTKSLLSFEMVFSKSFQVSLSSRADQSIEPHLSQLMFSVVWYRQLLGFDPTYFKFLTKRSKHSEVSHHWILRYIHKQWVWIQRKLKWHSQVNTKLKLPDTEVGHKLRKCALKAQNHSPTDYVKSRIHQDNGYIKHPPDWKTKTLIGIIQGQRQENYLQHNWQKHTHTMLPEIKKCFK